MEIFFTSALMILMLIRCAQPSATLPDQLKFSDIIGIIFDGSGGRLANAGDYLAISGSVTMQLTGAAENGSFLISYKSFSVPSLCTYRNACSCTGSLRGTYTPGSAPTSSADNGTTTPYSPNSTPTPSPTPSQSANVTTTYLALSIDNQNSSLSSGCPVEINRTVTVQIGNDKTLIFTDLGSDLLFKPRNY